MSNSIEGHEEPVPRTKKIPHSTVKFEANEESGIIVHICTVIVSPNRCFGHFHLGQNYIHGSKEEN